MSAPTKAPESTAEEVPEPSARRAWSSRAGRRFAVWYMRLAASVNLLAAVLAPLRNGIRRRSETSEIFTPLLVTSGFAAAAIAALLAIMLYRRKRAAWLCAVIASGLYVFLIVTVMALDPGSRGPVINWVTLVLTTVLLAALVASRREFYAKGARKNVRLALIVLAVGTLAAVAVGAFLVTLTSDDERDNSLSARILYTVIRVITLTPSNHIVGVSVPRWTDVIINILGFLVIGAVLYALFRAPKNLEMLTFDDETRLREQLDKWGERDSLGYFALRRDKSVIWSPSGKAAIAYRVVGGVSLASADPIGDPEAWPGAIDEWLAEAEKNAWVPAVMGASEEAGTIYARHGLDALVLGDEALVEVAEFTLEGRAMRVVRQAYNRVKRAGYTTRMRRHEDIPEAEMQELVELADHWRNGETERGFSMALGRLGDPGDGKCFMVECLDGEGKLRAILSFVPWGSDGLSLDLMRRDRDSENGLIEFMVLEVLEGAKTHGIERLSLNFAMFRSVFEDGAKLGAGPVLRMWRGALMFFSRWFQLESLYRSNAKYRPIWEPRFILFRKSSELPRIGIAAGRAEGFVTPPSLPEMFKRRRTG